MKVININLSRVKESEHYIYIVDKATITLQCGCGKKKEVMCCGGVLFKEALED